MTGGRWTDRGSWRTVGRPSGWDTRIRPPILNRDGHRCTWIATLPDGGHPLAPGAAEHPDRCTVRATDVDHIGDPADDSAANLRSLCPGHHRRRTAGQAGRAAQAARAARGGRRRPPEQHPGLIA